jgi:hypothetical protein
MTQFSARKLLTEATNPVTRKPDKMKMKPQREDYEELLGQAAIIMGGWMSFFPAPDCREQQEVVDATLEWLKAAKRTVE